MTTKFIGVGVGPGDPELLTLKAARLIQEADVISYIANEHGQSQAKDIAVLALQQVNKLQEEIPVVMPMSDDRTIANQVYDRAATAIQAMIASNKTVVFICEGDPLFFGSFAYLLERLQQVSVPCEVVPGISSVHAAASLLQLPLTVLKESLVVMSGRHSSEQLEASLLAHDSVVIMKAGRSRQKIIQALKKTQRYHEAKYLEYIGRETETVHHDIQQLETEVGPYFSLFVVLKRQRGEEVVDD